MNAGDIYRLQKGDKVRVTAGYPDTHGFPHGTVVEVDVPASATPYVLAAGPVHYDDFTQPQAGFQSLRFNEIEKE